MAAKSSIGNFVVFAALVTFSTVAYTGDSQLEEERLVITSNSTLISPNQTFSLGFFTPADAVNDHHYLDLYLGIWYASIPIRTYVWVANRRSPVRSHNTPPFLVRTDDGHLTVKDRTGSILWTTEDHEPGGEVRLLDTGNLVLLSATNNSEIVWQSFEHPTDTWLPSMEVTASQSITCWRSPSDPSPGRYSLRLRPPEYGELELVHNTGNNASGLKEDAVAYWSTGRWTGGYFTDVPEMTVPYIYKFRFDEPFTRNASFVYSEAAEETGVLGQLLTRFMVDSSGQLRQFTWSSQAASWNMFWSRPERPCSVYGLCGNLGFCEVGAAGLGDGGGGGLCECLSGLTPADSAAWLSGDFSGGCRRDVDVVCRSNAADMVNEELEEVGSVAFDGGDRKSFTEEEEVSLEFCKDSCLKRCSCLGISYHVHSRLCKNLSGYVLNLRNSTGSSMSQTLYLKVSRKPFTFSSSSSSSSSSPSTHSRRRKKVIVLVCSSVGGLLLLVLLGIIAFLLLWMAILKPRNDKRTAGEGGGEGGDYDDNEDERSVLAALTANLQVFTYKELATATRGFSEKLGHGGFGAVFRGQLAGDELVAVKRLERPGGGGDREFRAEVRTIGSIQHVNLVRLRGFCSEDPHRLLVYEYMPNGPLSTYLNNNNNNQQLLLSWPTRFCVALGAARGIAYLHEECRDCIIHCDIKPENILLDADYAAKVSDFGLAKLVGRDFSRVLTTMRGTWGYVAPEWISGVAITAKADVYSYGMTLLEIIGGRRNVDTAAGSGRECLSKKREEEEEGYWFFPPWAARKVVEGNVAAVVDAKLESEYDVAEAARAATTAVWCIQDQESARPAMGMVVKMLEGTVEVSAPPLPQLLQALVSGDSFPRHGIVSGAEVSPSSTASTATNDGISVVDASINGDVSAGMTSTFPPS